MRVKSRKSAAFRKNQILAWAKRNGRLPKYSSENVVERKFARRMENFLSVANKSTYDPEFRALIYSLYPRKINNKSRHNKEARVRELVSFMKANNRTPTIVNPEEKKLVAILGNFTTPSSPLFSKKVEDTVYDLDKCFRTLIPKRYRRCINVALEGSELVEE